MPKFIIIKTRTEDYEAEIEAENEEEAWELLHEGEVEFEFLQSDDEFIVQRKEAK
jgi:hypothetical protein